MRSLHPGDRLRPCRDHRGDLSCLIRLGSGQTCEDQFVHVLVVHAEQAGIAPPAHREEGQRVVVGAEPSFLPRRCVAIQPLERAQIAGGETRIAFEQRVAEADDHL